MFNDLQRATGSAAEICMKCRRTEEGASELVFLPLSPLAHYSGRARPNSHRPTDGGTTDATTAAGAAASASNRCPLPPAAPLGRSPQLSVSPATRQIRTEGTAAHRVQCTPLFRDPYIVDRTCKKTFPDEFDLSEARTKGKDGGRTESECERSILTEVGE